MTCLRPVLPPDILLISDGAAAYKAFVRQARITHRSASLRAGIRVKGAIQVQNVNAWQRQFKGWLKRFHGVASRYLSSYTGWQRLRDAALFATPARLLLAAIAKS